MHKRSSSELGFLNPRILLVCLCCFAAAILGAFGFSNGVTAPNRSEIDSAQAPAAPAVSAPTSCSIPGTLIASDPAADQTGSPANQQFDILSVSIAEPCIGDGSNKLVFTMKVTNLSSIPGNGHWKTQFVPPTLPSGVTAYFVEMTSDQSGNVAYAYGNVGTTTTTLGTADAGTFNADGTITITVANSKVGNPVPGNTLTKVQGRTQLLVGAAGTGLLSTLDTTTQTANDPTYTLVGHASCSCPIAPPTPTPAPMSGTGTPRFQNYVPPPTNSFNGGEPSLGSD